MDTIKKIGFLCMSMLMLNIQAEVKSYQFKSKDNAFAFIIGIHTKVFSKQNLITEHITMPDASDWYALLKGVEDYTRRNDKDRLPYYEKIRNASDTLINGLKIMYNTYILPALKDPKDGEAGIATLNDSKIDITKVDLDAIKNAVNKFRSTKEGLVNLQKSLKKKLLISSGSRNARGVLTNLAFVLEITIDKVFADYEKVKVYKMTNLFGSRFLGALGKVIPIRKK